MTRTVIEPAIQALENQSTPVSTKLTTSSSPQPPTVQSNRNAVAGITKRTLHAVGPLLVLMGFAAIFVYGHRNDWTLPKFGNLTGIANKRVDDWCEEHGVPESICVQCDPMLMPKGADYGWCAEHGVHNCLLHHPDLAQLKSPMSVEPADVERAKRALAVSPRKANNSECKVYQTRIQFASVESVKQAGVDVELVDRKRIVESVHGSGAIVYDPTRLASLASRAKGSVVTVRKNVGDRVTRGDVLAIIDAAEVGNLKTSLMRSLAEERLQARNVERLSEAKDAIPGSLLINAQASLSKARADVLSSEQSLRNLGLQVQLDELSSMTESQILNRLRFIGIPETLAREINSQSDTSNLIPIHSPLDGIVIERAVSPGEVVDTSKSLFQVADTSQMWLMLSVSQEHAGKLQIGQPVEFRSDAIREVVVGKIEWISTTADKTTRMIQVRAILENEKGKLRNETFGIGEVILRDEPNAIVIPTEATHWEGCCQVVFVRDKNYFDSPESYKVFHVRSMRLGAANGKFTEVISGVLPGEVIATAGSDVLRAQLLRNNLGAGCDCCAE
ncbi:MAG: efflux RND transporter periplasmic adaptor subunit [Pirellulaceae bacterium]|nr:efflux RND transporter periplasmic adaptor subunit [Pirellulaceae bacterium]